MQTATTKPNGTFDRIVRLLRSASLDDWVCTLCGVHHETMSVGWRVCDGRWEHYHAPPTGQRGRVGLDG